MSTKGGWSKKPQNWSTRIFIEMCQIFFFSVCDMAKMSPGLTAIVGPLSASAANHVQNMANQMHVPHIETRFDYAPETPPYSINIHPHPRVLGKSYADLIRALGMYAIFF